MEFPEVFAWSYEDMLGIDPKIAQHHIENNEDRMALKNQRGSH